jgi:hypothetical protein
LNIGVGVVKRSRPEAGDVLVGERDREVRRRRFAVRREVGYRLSAQRREELVQLRRLRDVLLGLFLRAREVGAGASGDEHVDEWHEQELPTGTSNDRETGPLAPLPCPPTKIYA